MTEQKFRALRDVVAETERAYILRALQISGGSKTRAAELLDISRKNLLGKNARPWHQHLALVSRKGAKSQRTAGNRVDRD